MFTQLAKKMIRKKLREWFKLIYEVVFGEENTQDLDFL